MKNVLLYFGANPEKKDNVCKILEDLHLTPIVVSDEENSQQVGYLMKLADFTKQSEKGERIPMDLMVFEDVDDDTIREFTKFSKLLHCEMPQKAMLTEHNKNWKLCDLLQEIEKEHAYFTYVEKIHTMLNESQHLLIDDYTKDSWKAYETAFYAAYDAIQKQCSMDEIKAVYERFCKVKEGLKKA